MGGLSGRRELAASWYQYREAEVADEAEKWVSDVYVVGQGLSLCGAVVVLVIMYETMRGPGTTMDGLATALQIVCLAVCDGLFAVVVLFWRALEDLNGGKIYCGATQPLSAAVEVWSILWSAAVAFSLGVAVSTRDTASTRLVGEMAFYATWPIGACVAAALYFAQSASVTRSSFGTCQYMRASAPFYVEVGAQFASWLVVCVANLGALGASMSTLRRAPVRVADRHLGRLRRFSVVGITLWGARMIADLSRSFPGRYNVLAIMWILPGFQGFLNALILTTGPLKSALSKTIGRWTRPRLRYDLAAGHHTRRRVSRHGPRRERPDHMIGESDVEYDAESDAASRGDVDEFDDGGTSHGSVRTRFQDSLVRHITFKPSEENTVRVGVKYPNEDSLLAQIAYEERLYRRSEMDEWLLRHHHRRSTSSDSLVAAARRHRRRAPGRTPQFGCAPGCAGFDAEGGTDDDSPGSIRDDGGSCAEHATSGSSRRDSGSGDDDRASSSAADLV